MKITFVIEYRTTYGERLYLSGSSSELGDWNEEQAIPLDYNQGVWETAINIDETKVDSLNYSYFVQNENTGTQRKEYAPRTLPLKAAGGKEIRVKDWWRAADDPENALYSSAFSNVLLKNSPKTRSRKASVKPAAKSKQTSIQFSIRMPRITDGYAVCVLGSLAELGEWNRYKPILLDGQSHPVWQAQIALQKAPKTLEFKFGIVDLETDKLVTLEGGPNRTLELAATDNSPTYCYIANCENFLFEEGRWKGAGVAIPVFSLRSENGHGVGEFPDLKLLIDWAKKTGLKMVQILPINDTVATHRWVDSYPYSAVSVFALHPIYLNLDVIGRLSAKATQDIIDQQKKRLNAKTFVDYEAVMAVKSRFFKLIFDEKREEFLADKEFLAFFEENQEWLKPYAAFSYLRDLYGTSDFSHWGQYTNPTPALLDQLTDPKAPQHPDIAVHYFVQYHLHRQLSDVVAYARKNEVVLKGDIPIGIFRYSVDSWLYPDLFNMDCQAGAPPDDFAVAGQNWGFPTYNWEEMAKDGYLWWQKRLQKLSAYFDAFRIDHILGFFRIWEIPTQHVQGLMGRFNPSLPISKQELYENGISFDYHRMCEPFVTASILSDLFGPDAPKIQNEFFDQTRPDRFVFKEQFNNQKAIESRFEVGDDASTQEKATNQRLKNGLLELVGEVLFFDAPGVGQAFNPRISLQKTKSYQALDSYAKSKLDAAYYDYFYRRHEDFWKEQALVKLPAIKNATNMLICGEDLGMVPGCVPGVMNELGILSLEIQRMPKQQDTEFGIPANYPYPSICSPSCHDMSTIRGWWEEDQEKTQHFYNQILGQDGQAPYFCEPWVVKSIINQHLHCPSMWAVFPIQDFLGIDSELRRDDVKSEQINVPSNPKNFWKYRLHISLEDLLEQDHFNQEVREMIDASGRNSVF